MVLGVRAIHGISADLPAQIFSSPMCLENCADVKTIALDYGRFQVEI